MSKLTSKERKALPTSEFAGPDRSYPINNASHAANAKARATQMVKRGRLSVAQKVTIDRKADTILGGSAADSEGSKASARERMKSRVARMRK